MSEHLITPSPELVQQWWDFADQHCDRDDPKTYFDDIATQAARWGADQELEACCEALARLVRGDRMAEYLCAVRRPKPQSLKQQALEALKHAPGPDYPSHITLLTANGHALSAAPWRPSMTDLSPAAEAVWQAAWDDCPVQCGDIMGTRRKQIAAALRAAADQVVPLHICGTNATRAQTRLGIRHKLLAIAAELEVQP